MILINTNSKHHFHTSIIPVQLRLNCTKYVQEPARGIIISSLRTSQTNNQGHLPNFLLHFDFAGGSAISNEDIFGAPFSKSKPRSFGVGGTSSILVAPLMCLLGFWTSFGKVDLLGVSAVATRLADLRIVFRTSHDRFLARYHNTEDATTSCQQGLSSSCFEPLTPNNYNHNNANDNRDYSPL